ncbi:restriction endonuclease-related protein [Pseudomonas sp. S2_H01]
MDVQRSEHLLGLLAKAAHLVETNRTQALLFLREAQAHLWRFVPDSPLLTASELERMLSVPLEQWLPEIVRVDYNGALLSGNLPTHTCNELLLELDAKQIWESIQLRVKEVRDLCRFRKDGDLHYRRFRRFLIEHAVVLPYEAAVVFIPLGLEIKDFYEAIPQAVRDDGHIFRCPECQWPMSLRRSEVQCDSAWCREHQSLFTRDGKKLINRVTGEELRGEPVGERLMLKSALWKFTLIPGLLELRLATQLATDGFDVTLWPDVDRSDLAIRLPDKTLELDAKVWISTQALSRHIAQLPSKTPRWIVVPDYQKSHVPSLREHCPPGIEVFTQSDCSKELKKHAKPF